MDSREGEAGEEDNWIPGRGRSRRIKWIPGGDGAGVHFHCPPCLSDVCSFMTDCIRPDRTSVADMWTIENVLRLRLHAGRNENMPGYVLHAGEIKICLDMFCMRGNAEKIKNCEIGSDVWLCYTGIKSFAGGAKISDAVFHARQIGWDALFCRIAIKTVGYCG